MFYFAKVEENNSVSEVIVVLESDCGNLQFPESEEFGQSFLSSLGKGGKWLQTSTTGEFRKCCASIGSEYIASIDIFTQPKPYPSWVLNSDYEWESPVPKPELDGFWYWDENSLQWVR